MLAREPDDHEEIIKGRENEWCADTFLVRSQIILETSTLVYSKITHMWD